MRSHPRSLAPLLAAALLASACASAPARNDPFETLERSTLFLGTQTAPRGTLELEAGLELDPGDASSARVAAKLGLTDATELSLELAPYAELERPGPDVRGAGDATLGTTTRFVEEDGARPSLALGVAATIPVGADGISGEEVEGEVALVASRAVGAFVASGRVGAVFRDDAGGGLDLEPTAAVALARTLAPRLASFLELDVRDPPDADTAVSGSAGLGWSVSERVLVDVAARVGLAGDDPDAALVASVLLTL